MLTLLYIAGLALALALLFGIYFKLDGLPLRVWSLVQKERDDNAGKALDAMKETVAARAGASVVAIQRYEESLAAGFRAQVAEAQTRARVSERRAADTETALQSAVSLVRELRAALDAMPGGAAARNSSSGASSPAEPGDAERETREIALPRAGADDEEELGEDEKTRVGKQPGAMAGTSRRCIPPPSGGRSRGGGGAS
jgi:hypothetical protein